MTAIENAVWSFVERHFDSNDVKKRNGQLIIRECPFCHGGENHEEFTFAIGLFNGAYNCMRANNCNVKGSFNDLLAKYGERPMEFDGFPTRAKFELGGKKKTYIKPDPEEFREISPAAKKYLRDVRRISEQTIEDWKIMSDDKGNIVFPFYRNGVLTYIKYRVPRKFDKEEGGAKEWMMPGTESILFGMDNVSFNKPLVITEGEIDALSLYEAGVTNVVSVPAGANNLDWINSCWDWLESFNQIILFGDSDPAGIKMVTTVMNRLGEDRCMIPKEYPELNYNGKDFGRLCKDANEILICHGPEMLRKMVDACEPAPVKGLIDVSTIPYYEPDKEERILTKIPSLDLMIGGFGQGGITIVSGKRAQGKSTIGNTFILNAIEQGYKCCVYSGELGNKKFMNWLSLTATESKYVGYQTIQQTGKNICCISRQIHERICDWLGEKLYLFDNKEIFDVDLPTAVLKCFEAAARRYGCQLFIVDNLMSLLTTGDEENRAQGKFMAQLKAFATKYNVHVIVVDLRPHNTATYC